jgi:hypothetical protein
MTAMKKAIADLDRALVLLDEAAHSIEAIIGTDETAITSTIIDGLGEIRPSTVLTYDLFANLDRYAETIA